MKEKIKIIFAGTADVATPLLRKLFKDENFELMLVITQVDKPAGRKMELTSSPIKVVANELDIPLFQPENINDSSSIKRISSLKPDIIVVMAYGQIVSKEILDIPTFNCLNVHASILPKYRGASPIQSAILNQEIETGVCLMKMEEKMDTGPVYKEFRTTIESDDNLISLTEKLAHITARNIPNAIVESIENKIEPVKQNEENATYCNKISKSDGLVNWNEDVKTIDAKIRAFTGWPSVYTFWNGKRLKIIEAAIQIQDHQEESGNVIKDGDNTLISAKNGFIKPIHIQIEGKSTQTIVDFINGNPNFINSKLG